MKFCPSCGGIAAEQGCVTSVGLSPKYGPLLRIDCQVLGTSHATAPLAPGPAHDILAELGRFLSIATAHITVETTEVGAVASTGLKN